jgi:hypothetical protein
MTPLGVPGYAACPWAYLQGRGTPVGQRAIHPEGR